MDGETIYQPNPNNIGCIHRSQHMLEMEVCATCLEKFNREASRRNEIWERDRKVYRQFHPHKTRTDTNG